MRQYINKNLISLKCVLFAFFAGIGCLIPFFTAHIKSVGLTFNDACIISVVAPCVALLGPLIFGPLADKLSIGRGCETSSANAKTDNPTASMINNKSNGVLRLLIAFCLIMAALFYGLLLVVPRVQSLEPRRPSVSFMCDENGARIYQEMCTDDKVCNHWNGEKTGSLILSNCHYTCERPPVPKPLYVGLISTSEKPQDLEYDTYDSNLGGDDDDDIGTIDIVPPEVEVPSDDYVNLPRSRRSEPPIVEPPHLCYHKSGGDVTLCEAFTPETERLKIDASLLSALDDVEYAGENDTIWCKYPFGGSFQCQVPEKQVEWMIGLEDDYNSTCNPIVECNVEDPYDSPEGVLAESQCKLYIGDPSLSFWLYLVLRALGDIFATATVCLLSTACVIATRETSIGRGDVGRQLLFGVLGLTIVPPIMGAIQSAVGEDTVPYLVPILVAICLFIISAIIMIFAIEMPLSPPEWWWHIKSGLLALPMNTVRRYGLEICGVLLVLTILGIFWSALNTYIAWTVKEMKGLDILLSITMTVGAIPAIPVLWKAERLVDYCGHSNIFIGAFTFYILRYTAMAVLEDPWWVLLCEALEVFTLSLMWVTAVLYFRHLVPRKYTSTGQALPVIAHFCIGRSLGALIGLVVKKAPALNHLQPSYEAMAITACVLALLYLILYHFLLAPWCRASFTGPPNPIAMQGLNGNGASNGSYTPLRVYHDEKGRKGQFRY